MAHFARINAEGVVTQIIVADKEFIESGKLGSENEWIQYSYNTRGGVHYDPNTGEPSEDQSKALRKNAACMGGFYDKKDDVFYPPQPYHLWTLNQETYLWEPPESQPEYEGDGSYKWKETKDENSQWYGEWILIKG